MKCRKLRPTPGPTNKRVYDAKFIRLIPDVSTNALS